MFRRFLNLFRPNRLEADIREELEFHQAQTSGAFGNIALIQDQTRDASTIVWLETLLQDLRYACRQLRRTPVLSIVAVLSLALGIGANTAIFTLINAVMLQKLPVKDPDRLVLFYGGLSQGTNSGRIFPWADILSYADWEYFRDHNESFASVCAFKQGPERLVMHLAGSTESGPKEYAGGHLVSANYFEVLGVQAAAGRVLNPEDDAPAAPPVAVISYNFWRHRFNLDRLVIGKAVNLNGTAFTIVGVAPREFFGERVETPPDLWLPFVHQPQIMQRESWLARPDMYWLNLLGRLKPGITLQRAQTTLNTQLQQFYTAQLGARISPERRRQMQQVYIELKPGARGISRMRFTYSEPLRLLMAIVALVLLIACANVATLFLGRASARRHELFARLALGASRTRLIRQLLTESILLSLLGGAAGVAFAWWSVKALAVMVGVDSVVKLAPDLLVLSFTLGISVLTGIAFGLAPALHSSRMEYRTGPYMRSRFNPAHAFVVLQVALSSVLLIGAGLLTHSLIDLDRQDLGFNRENLLLVRTDARLAGYQPAGSLPVYRQLVDRLNAIPGVASASIAKYSPLSGSRDMSNLSIEGYVPATDKEMNISSVPVGPQFFETLGIPLLIGRPIEWSDTRASTAVAVVNESFVREFLPNQYPIGRRFNFGAPFKAPGREIVGVVSDSRYYSVADKPKPMAFFSAWQPTGQHPREEYVGELLIRTSQDASGAIAEVRRAIREVDSKLPIVNVTTLREQTYNSLRQQRMFSRLCSFFGLLALLLASIGLYGTMAYSVVRRTNEIGLRMALGAERVHVLWMVLRESAVLVILGLTFGLPLAMVATSSLKSFLFGIPPFDPAGIGAAILILAVASTLAGYLPALRATRVDPMVALRRE